MLLHAKADHHQRQVSAALSITTVRSQQCFVVPAGIGDEPALSAVIYPRDGENKTRRQPVLGTEPGKCRWVALCRDVPSYTRIGDHRIAHVDTGVFREIIQR